MEGSCPAICKPEPRALGAFLLREYRGHFLTWWESGLTMVCLIEMKVHPVASLVRSVDLFLKFGPSIVLKCISDFEVVICYCSAIVQVILV
jgi:hypothetical protein